MTREKELFLAALKAAMRNEYVHWDMEISSEEWDAILHLAEAHRVLPMVFQAVYACPAAARVDRALTALYRQKAMQMVVVQTRKTAEFLPLLRALQDAGAEPLVVKGIVCRKLYPNPDHRLSSDEDVWIPPEKMEVCHRVMTEYGLRTPDPDAEDYELPYTSTRGSLYVEIHKSLFPPEHEAYGDLNRFFTNTRARSGELRGVPTMDCTDHMLYLVCHAFKHFLHSGFGIRQVCDMIFFANAYGDRIDWIRILDRCRQIRAEQFTAGIFRIGWKYLDFSLEKSRYPLQWQAIYVDEGELLEDILQAGVYGSSDRSRVHSSRITLDAFASQKRGSRKSNGLLKTVFPSAKELEGRYPYLKTKPLLLPVAWTDRILKYQKETASGASAAGESIRIGSRRVELLKRYGILDKN